MEEQYIEEISNEILDGEENEDLKEIQESNFDDLVTGDENRSGVWKLFNNIWKSKDTIRVSNLTSIEIGLPHVNVRGSLHASDVAARLGQPALSDFFREQAEIVSRTSGSRKGWLPELFVSQKRSTTRGFQNQLPVAEPQTNAKLPLFGKAFKK